MMKNVLICYVMFCYFLDSGLLLTTGWNGCGQLCHGDTVDRCYLATVNFFVEKGEFVTDVCAEAWNTYVKTR